MIVDPEHWRIGRLGLLRSMGPEDGGMGSMRTVFREITSFWHFDDIIIRKDAILNAMKYLLQ